MNRMVGAYRPDMMAVGGQRVLWPRSMKCDRPDPQPWPHREEGHADCSRSVGAFCGITHRHMEVQRKGDPDEVSQERTPIPVLHR